MKPKKKIQYKLWSEFSILKATEGGLSQATVRERCRELGIPVRFGYSPYVGQYAATVPSRFALRFQRKVLHWFD